MGKVVGLGEILWDIFPNQKVLGGAPANFAYHISQFGLDGYVVSAVGQDSLGKEILDNLTEKGLHYLIETTPFPTGSVDVFLDNKGIPQYQINENVAWDNIPFSEKTKNLAKNTTTVCFGSLAQRHQNSRETIHLFLDTMPKDSLKIFDINLRLHYFSPEIIENSLEKANILKINDEEVVKVAKLFDWKGSERTICEKLASLFHLDFLILTKGTAGSLILSPNHESFLPTPKVNVVDTVGAGDSFTAAFVASHLKGYSLEEAHQLAVEVSAYVCGQHGAMPKLAEHHLQSFRKS
ncbi:MAG: carbohydrate kinase [Capnocytophaga sp.]|nr:carbohydrate kinase [Capnocytophaga sp.]